MRRIGAFLFLGIFAVAFGLSAGFLRKRDTARLLLYYPSYDSVLLCTEARYIPMQPRQGGLALLVDELLLGPMTNRYKRIFPRGTKALYCFEKDGTLYVGVSEEALLGGEGLSIHEGVDLLKLNIVKNFTYLNKIDVSIDGKSAFED